MNRWLAAFAALPLAACVPGADRLKPALDAGDVGTLWLVTDERDVLSGDLSPDATEAARRNVRSQLAEFMK